eukprot:COSAG06_NODE_17030_length_965_cov_131.496536_1_plen_102_part_01
MYTEMLREERMAYFGRVVVLGAATWLLSLLLYLYALTGKKKKKKKTTKKTKKTKKKKTKKTKKKKTKTKKKSLPRPIKLSADSRCSVRVCERAGPLVSFQTT